MVRLAAILAVGVGTLAVHAQSAKAFDAVSIKRNLTGADASETETTPGRLRLINVTPLSLLVRAFGVQAVQIVGAPSWASTERYDVVAVDQGGDELSDRSRQPFLQAMLAGRWQLRAHREEKRLGVYSLLVVKDGVRLTPHSGPGEYAMKVQRAGARVVLRSTRGNIPRLVEILGGFTGMLVTNDTGLSGEYDFTLEWIQDPSGDAAGPSLFTALQEQIGLKLEHATKPVPVVVIDRLERPSAD